MDEPPRRRLESILQIAVGAVVLVALTATLTYTLVSIASRPLDGVEGEVLFEAERLRRGLPLYVDPLKGAFDYGPVPARYFVLYPPVWSWVLSLVPKGAASIVARGIGVLAWFGGLSWIAWRAQPACRRTAWLAAAFVASVYTLTLFAVAGRPDGLALLLAALALERSARRGEVDAVAAVLFALAPWVKPNVIGLAVGAFAVDLAIRRTRAWRTLALAVATTALVGGILDVASGGSWLSHLLRSTAQPLSLDLWLRQAWSRGQFLALPIAFAASCAIRGRRTPGVRLALGALVTSTTWGLLCLAKIGSASNLFIEPVFASLVLVARAEPPIAARRLGFLSAFLVQAIYGGVASVRSSFEEIVTRFPAEQRALSRAREVCGARPGDVILGDEPGIELAENDRIVASPFQMTHLARRGLYPLAPWIADVRQPSVVGLLTQDDLLERPLGVVSVAHDRFGPELRKALVERFELAETNGDWHTYRLRR